MSNATGVVAAVAAFVGEFKSPLDLAGLAPYVAAAVSGHIAGTKKWKTLAEQSYKRGVRVAMLKRGTKDEPNPQFCEGTYSDLRLMVIASATASNKPEKFSKVQPWATGADALKLEAYWTIADILMLTTAQIRELNCKMLTRSKREYIQLVDGALFSQIRKYIDEYENPDRVREPKKKKADAAKPTADVPTLDQMAALLQVFNAQVLTFKDAEGKTLSNVLQMHETGLHLAALIGQNRKTK
jgi:hypothetical protein